MSKIEFDLENGLKVNGEAQKHVVIREITMGDILAANEKARTVYLTKQGPVLMCPEDQVMVYILERCITQFGDMKQISKAELCQLSARDFDILVDHYLLLREKSNVDDAGRDNPPL